ncbi:MAG: hypothetical protein ACJ767_10535, partial [Chloroflexota bacterium]
MTDLESRPEEERRPEPESGRSRKRMIQPRRTATPEEAAHRAASRDAGAVDDSVVIRTRRLTKAYGDLVAVD